MCGWHPRHHCCTPPLRWAGVDFEEADVRPRFIFHDVVRVRAGQLTVVVGGGPDDSRQRWQYLLVPADEFDPAPPASHLHNVDEEDMEPADRRADCGPCAWCHETASSPYW